MKENDKEMLEKLLAGLKKYDETHKRVRDDEMFSWFHDEGLMILNTFSDVHTSFDYREDENGIDVDIVTKSLLLLPDIGDELVNLLLKAGKCEVKAIDNKLHISLWFCGWKDIEIGE